MAEIVIERWTRCPTGKPADEISFEIVLEDDDARPITNLTRRTTTLRRVFTRGTLAAVADRTRDVMLTTGRGTSRTIARAARLADGHLDVDVSALALTLSLPLVRGVAQSWDLYCGPARGTTTPTDDTSFDTYVTRTRTALTTRSR